MILLTEIVDDVGFGIASDYPIPGTSYRQNHLL